MATDGLSKNLGIWDMLSTNVKLRLADLSHLEPTVQELDTVIFEGRALQAVQETYRKQLRETTHKSKDLVRRGRGIRNRLVAGLQGAFGVESFELLDYGVQPRLPQKRKRLTKEEKAEKERLEKLEKAVEEAGLDV
jgi:hypothetical protein